MPLTRGRHVIIDFMDLDTSKITFSEKRDNKHGGAHVGIKYNGKSLLVRYKARNAPFGVSSNKEDVSKTNERGKYTDDKKITGYGISVILPDDDEYVDKAEELDQFFIKNCISNSVVWGLGGSKEIPISSEVISGYDDKGVNGKWKRMLKHSYTVDKKTGERIYNSDPPRLNFGILTSEEWEEEGESGYIRQCAKFYTKLFDKESVLIRDVSCRNIKKSLPPTSNVAVLASWGCIYIGSYGASMKPKAQQIKVLDKEGFDMEELLLDDEEPLS